MNFPVTSLFYVFCLIIYITNAAFAADINLTILENSRENQINVSIINRSSIPVQIQKISLIFNSQEYQSNSLTIPSQTSYTKTFDVTPPAQPVVYPLIITVSYLNDGHVLSLKHVGRFITNEDTTESFARGKLQNLTITQQGNLVIESDTPHIWQLILPNEIRVLNDTTIKKIRVWHIQSTTTGLNNSYPIFAIAETEKNGRHYTSVINARLMIIGDGFAANRGETHSYLLIIVALLSLAWFIIAINTKHSNQLLDTSTKYTARIFLLSISYWLLKNLPFLISWTADKLMLISESSWPLTISQYFIEHLTGKNYSYFFTYFIDIYYWTAIVILFPYFYYTDSHIPITNDKYVNLVRSITTIPNIFTPKKIHWNEQSKLGILTICVKLFFAPMLVSWVINNILHINNLLNNQTVWNLHTINSFVVDWLILIDTGIFAFGYTIESRYLKNVIKSVEPTLLGWVVCLWCYPPFNAFSFKPFDIPLWNISIQHRPDWLEGFILYIITGLWGIFVWGSVALGFKGSNLTNRGIISHGPYRFCRHPAYTAKVLVWWLEGVFFARYGLSMLIAFTIIYGLRAWTEERHLMRDPDYLEYIKKVRWRCIPGIL